MIASELWLIYALAFGATLLGVQGLYWLLYKERRDQKAINRRLALNAQLSSPADVLEVLRKERGADLLATVPCPAKLQGADRPKRRAIECAGAAPVGWHACRAFLPPARASR